MEVRAEVNFLEEDKFQVNTFPSEVTFNIDKKRQGYVSKGANPLELFLSALGGCIAVYAKRYLIRHSLKFKKLKIQVRGELSESPPTRLINIRVDVSTDAKIEDKKEVFLYFIKNCPIHNTIFHTQQIDINLS